MSTYLSDTTENLTVDAPSARFTYRRMGPRGGIPLILLNRVRATIDWWDPQLLDHLAADRDVIIFDDIGVGYTTGEPRDSVDGFADGAIEFIEALGLTQVDLLGWTLGGTVAQRVALRRPDLVRKLVLAASNPGGQTPAAPAPDAKVFATMTKPEVTGDDLVYLFFPETDTGRAAGHDYLARVATRLATGGPGVSEAAGKGHITAIGKNASIPFEQVRADLENLDQPVLYATGLRDIMTPAVVSYTAAEHTGHATLLGYSDAGHAFLFQHAEAFAVQVANFLDG
ncbi:alpha/beta fold hydrolase [Nocardia abscessus]|uniref:alpha/beta fold hydrolase n=1 Tax=Nocardia abscessus TaxID=120957 RepID=UPI000317F12E|nr:alpha/beta hydrolase [Nocardia abscessus]MCC3331397.1 alpha/beta hydrolase [Nocardia abscessus]